MPTTPTELRPVGGHERPVFGSVWSWGWGSGTRFLVLGLGEPGPTGLVHLHAIALHEHAPRVHDMMTWGYVNGSGLHVTTGWYCVQEAPTGSLEITITASWREYGAALKAASEVLRKATRE